MRSHIAKTAQVGKGCVIGYNVAILDNVRIGDNTCIGHNVVIHKGTKIGTNVLVDSGSILGRMPSSVAISRNRAPEELPPLEVGDGCKICSGVILHAGVKIGRGVLIGNHASIQHWSSVGDNSVIGRAVNTDPRAIIGSRVKIEAGVAVGPTVIEDDVYIGPGVMFTDGNAMGRFKTEPRGPHIKRGARIGAGVIFLPGVVIGEDAVVAAGAVVTHDVPDRKVVMGVPARVVRDVPEDELLVPKEIRGE